MAFSSDCAPDRDQVVARRAMLFRTPHASKFGFHMLNWHLAKWGFVLNDNKWMTPTAMRMGFCMIPRVEFRARLASATREPGKDGCWQVETDLKTVADWQSDSATLSAA